LIWVELKADFNWSQLLSSIAPIALK
jgi:hypothetical protein